MERNILNDLSGELGTNNEQFLLLWRIFLICFSHYPLVFNKCYFLSVLMQGAKNIHYCVKFVNPIIELIWTNLKVWYWYPELIGNKPLAVTSNSFSLICVYNFASWTICKPHMGIQPGFMHDISSIFATISMKEDGFLWDLNAVGALLWVALMMPIYLLFLLLLWYELRWC